MLLQVGTHGRHFRNEVTGKRVKLSPRNEALIQYENEMSSDTGRISMSPTRCTVQANSLLSLHK